MAFSLQTYPWVYRSQYNEGRWEGGFVEKEHLTPTEEAALPKAERTKLIERRNFWGDAPLVSFTTQYGIGCFEGLKAFPQKSGELKLFRPYDHGKRFARSAEVLGIACVSPEEFLNVTRTLVHRNKEIGFFPAYDPNWEKEWYAFGEAIYLRPFLTSEAGVGMDSPKHPWFIVIGTPVTSFFDMSKPKGIAVSGMIRATPNGIGDVKCMANYAVSLISRTRVAKDGYDEALFLDAQERRYVEEGAACNFFCVLDDDSLVTPPLSGTILAGITRDSALTLARDRGLKVQERPLPIEEVFDAGREIFVTGTAAGIVPFAKLCYGKKVKHFQEGRAIGPMTDLLVRDLRGVQYGQIEDRHGWLVSAKELAETVSCHCQC